MHTEMMVSFVFCVAHKFITLTTFKKTIKEESKNGKDMYTVAKAFGNVVDENILMKELKQIASSERCHFREKV